MERHRGMITVGTLLRPDHVALNLRSTAPTAAIDAVAELVKGDPALLDWQALLTGVHASAPCLPDPHLGLDERRLKIRSADRHTEQPLRLAEQPLRITERLVADVLPADESEAIHEEGPMQRNTLEIIEGAIGFEGVERGVGNDQKRKA